MSAKPRGPGGEPTLVAHPGQVRGTVIAPPSKSYTHRAFLLGLLAEGETAVDSPLLSEDPLATLSIVEQLGASVDRREATVRIDSTGFPQTPSSILDCMNSGTTLRLVSAIAALAPGASVLTGDASLRRRHMKPLLAALEPLGVRAESTRDNGCAPIVVRGPLTGGTAMLPGDVSSQFVSALLLAGARSAKGVEVRLASALKSRPYVEITIEMLRDFGGSVQTLDDGFRVPGEQALAGRAYRVPGDYSTAAFPLAAAALAGRVRVENLPEASAQGDRAILDHLAAFGANVSLEPRAATVERAHLRGARIDLGDTPDLFPILAAVAACASGETVLSGAEHLRYKESDRIAAMVENLRLLGVDAEERKDGAVIRGGRPIRMPSPGVLATMGDHRILMALSVLALRSETPLVLDDTQAHAVSYPTFLEDFGGLGQRLEVRP